VSSVAESSKQSAPIPHLSVDERAASGRAARSAVPRSAHAELTLESPRDPVALLEAQAPTRVADLVPIRYGRMLVSPFTFYRGAAAVMAYDLAGLPRTDLTVQLCGDAHLANFGGYASPERTLVFDLNDFDETLPGPFEWDVKRLAASFEIAGRNRGFTRQQRESAVLGVVRSYREAMRQFASMSNLDVWYARLDAAEIEARLREQQNAKQQAKRFTAGASRATTKTSTKAFSKLTEMVDGEVRLKSDPPLIVPIRDLAGHSDIPWDEVVQELHTAYRNYRRTLQRDRRHALESYRWVELARKVVGVGSVGTRCFILLLLGRDDADPLFLQVKEAQASVLEPYLGKSGYANAGQRVVEGQRLMQSVSDIFLGFVHIDRTFDGSPRDLYLRQLWDWKTSVDLEVIVPRGLEIYADLCGWILARAHARSGDRIAIAEYLGKSDSFDRALASFAATYADQNERDYDALAAAARDGRVTVQSGL
jgi:uncharacterized protein (DUF2252 family)